MSILDHRAWLALLLALAAAFGLGYWRGSTVATRTERAACAAGHAALQAAAASQQQADAGKAHEASTNFQQEQTHVRTQIRTIRETVVRTVPGPCLSDDSVRQLNSAVAGVPDSAASR